jgi:2-polyprenyl-3-methyl-5-hydroxy-6-metoxy-1,4-benzoquinol methylase
MIENKDSLVTVRQACPVCNSKNISVLFSAKHNSPGFLDFIKFEAFYSKEYYEGYHHGSLGELTYSITECNDCHLTFLLEVLSDKGMGLLYNDWLDKEKLKEYYSKMEYSMYEETMLKVLKKHFSKKEKINLMDFGAGYGNFCSIATSLKYNTYAFDISADKNDHMNSMGVTIINNLDKYKNYFDFIYVNQVFEHVSQPLAILKTLQQSVSKDGFVFLAVPDAADTKKILNEQGLSNDLFKLLSPHQHVNGFSNNTLKLLASNAGLTAMTMTDFLQLYSPTLNVRELTFLAKKVIKNSKFGTGLFFKKTN